MNKVFSFDNHLYMATGAHRVLVDIHNALKDNFCATILGTVEYSKLNPTLAISKNEYQRLKNPFILRHSVLFVHQRRLAMIFSILNILLFLKVKVVYVHHSILKGQRLITFYPKHIITISDKCIANLTDYFCVPQSRITKIYNSVPDTFLEPHQPTNGDKIRLLYPATVYPVKRQLELVKHLKNELSNKIEIVFAGNGEDYDELCRVTDGDPRFTCMGFVANIKELMKSVDYCLLFSAHEGLPISLIEATMMGVPIICNDVGGNLEIGINGFNAFVCNNWRELINRLNTLDTISSTQYRTMSDNSRMHYINNFTQSEFKINYSKYVKNLFSK